MWLCREVSGVYYASAQRVSEACGCVKVEEVLRRPDFTGFVLAQQEGREPWCPHGPEGMR